jgi:hypothetical protein
VKRDTVTFPEQILFGLAEWPLKKPEALNSDTSGDKKKSLEKASHCQLCLSWP